MTAESFWDFSVGTYRMPGVPESCLSLQNDYGADVNMLLYCAWIAATIGPFDDELFERASAFSARWAEQVVIPLRKSRTWLKQEGCESEPVPTDSCMEFREQIKAVEFAAEKMQQDALESMVAIDRSRQTAPAQLVANVLSNLMIYLEYRHIPVNSDVRDKLLVIIRSAFPDIDERTIASALTD